MTRAELMHRLSAREFVEWQLYYGLEPFGAERDAAHAAIIASTVANYSGMVSKPAPLTDFMPEYDRQPPTPEQSAELQARREQDLYHGLHALAEQSKRFRR